MQRLQNSIREIFIDYKFLYQRSPSRNQLSSTISTNSDQVEVKLTGAVGELEQVPNEKKGLFFDKEMRKNRGTPEYLEREDGGFVVQSWNKGIEKFPQASINGEIKNQKVETVFLAKEVQNPRSTVTRYYLKDFPSLLLSLQDAMLLGDFLNFMTRYIKYGGIGPDEREKDRYKHVGDLIHYEKPESVKGLTKRCITHHGGAVHYVSAFMEEELGGSLDVHHYVNLRDDIVKEVRLLKELEISDIGDFENGLAPSPGVLLLSEQDVDYFLRSFVPVGKFSEEKTKFFSYLNKLYLYESPAFKRYKQRYNELYLTAQNENNGANQKSAFER